jgi:hypothetical protein
MLLAIIADQSQLNYLALESVIDAMRELSDYDEELRLQQEVEEQQARAKKAAEDGVTVNPNARKTTSNVSSIMKAKQKISTVDKKLKFAKKGAYQIFDLISKSHLSTRLWLKARQAFVQFMFNQVNDAGKAKGNDENIIRDFGDLKYYCERGLGESEEFYDTESKGFFLFIEASLDLVRGVSLTECLAKLDRAMKIYSACRQLSAEGLQSSIKVALLRNDLAYSINILGSNNANSSTNKLVNVYNSSIDSLLCMQKAILDELKTNGGEAVEVYSDRQKGYLDNVSGDQLRNVFNPLYHFLVHVKARLGSCLILRSSYIDNSSKPRYLF